MWDSKVLYLQDDLSKSFKCLKGIACHKLIWETSKSALKYHASSLWSIQMAFPIEQYFINLERSCFLWKWVEVSLLYLSRSCWRSLNVSNHLNIKALNWSQEFVRPEFKTGMKTKMNKTINSFKVLHTSQMTKAWSWWRSNEC